jgi:predicted TPR repeat methyltransferase
MKPSDIAQAYDTITHLWESEQFNMNNGIEQHNRAVSFVEKRGLALDVGCGCTGRFIDLLQGHGFTAQGVDLSTAMLDLAKDKHPDVEFFNEDICEWTPPKKYDFITAWDSIWHIPLEQQECVLTKLVSALNSNGVLIFSCGGTREEGDHTDSTMGPEVYYSTLGTKGFLKLFLGLDCLVRHLEYDQYPEIHTYFIIQKI